MQGLTLHYHTVVKCMCGEALRGLCVTFVCCVRLYCGSVQAIKPLPYRCKVKIGSLDAVRG